MSVRSGNPVFSEDTFRNLAQERVAAKPMTVEGTVNKTLILLLIAVATASITWSQVMTPTIQSYQMLMPLFFGGMIGGFIAAWITCMNPSIAGWTAPVYAALEGLVLGAFSAFFNVRYPGLPVQAVVLTFGVLLTMLVAYRSRLIQVTDKFRMGVVAATGGICIAMFAALMLQCFGVNGPADMMFFSHSPLAIGISLVIVVVAALNLALDFDLIERGVAARMPSYMEWYSGFALMVTLVWLYMRILRLLGQLSGRR